MTRPILRVLVGLGLAAALIALILASKAPRGPLAVSGLLEGDEVRLGSRVGGRVQAVLVSEGAAVESGQVLLTLEPFDLDEQLAQARAELGARRARLEQLERGYRPEEVAQALARRDEAAAFLEELRQGPRPHEVTAAREALALAQAELDLAARERARVGELQRAGTTSREALDIADARWKTAGARVAAEQARLALLLEGTRPEQIAQAEARLRQAEAAHRLAVAGFRPEEVAVARHEVAAAQAQVAALVEAHAELALRAPLPSVVEALELQPGELIGAGAPVLALRTRGRLWVRAYVPAPLLPRVGPGVRLPVRVDGLREPFTGRVTFVAREAEFTPSNVQTPDERQRQVFRVHVELEDPDDRLRPGMSADVVLGPHGDEPLR